MYIDAIELINYRNYEKLELKLNNKINIFVGENAQGKTNVLEAMYFFSALKSHRTNKDRELISWNKNKAYIKADVVKNLGNYKLEFLLDIDGKKQMKLNGVKVNKSTDVLGTLNTVIFSPEDLKLIKEGPSLRRRFIDNELSQIRPKYYYILNQYNKVLMQRNNILKTLMFSPSNRATLEIFSEQLADYGSIIIQNRIEFIKKLTLIARLIHRKITDGKEELEVLYRSDINFNTTTKEIKENLLDYYIKHTEDDIKKGFTLVGPHRDDLAIFINGIDVRNFGSQGQQRTAALSLKLSELEIVKAEVGEYPVLLLDDVLSELDPKRQFYLLNSLKDIQTIITCTSIKDIDIKKFAEKSIFEVNKGTIVRLE
ncbi:DNA replication/repair protein RecF [Caloramator sp. ALD01]|uniref:DNA replication/repair protein RecF n=1 Tax=Caloramator sp. ALD01 TaxID=1031288 RepID=UPI00041D1F48|nr:DNA replication/repair protein RecF [Caloramator sp. ALD01]